MQVLILHTKMDLTKIDPSFEEPKLLFEIKRKKKGIRGLFYDFEKDYWEVVARILKRKLQQIGIVEHRT